MTLKTLTNLKQKLFNINIQEIPVMSVLETGYFRH